MREKERSWVDGMRPARTHFFPSVLSTWHRNVLDQSMYFTDVDGVEIVGTYPVIEYEEKTIPNQLYSALLRMDRSSSVYDDLYGRLKQWQLAVLLNRLKGFEGRTTGWIVFDCIGHPGFMVEPITIAMYHASLVGKNEDPNWYGFNEFCRQHDCISRFPAEDAYDRMDAAQIFQAIGDLNKDFCGPNEEWTLQRQFNSQTRQELRRYSADAIEGLEKSLMTPDAFASRIRKARRHFASAWRLWSLMNIRDKEFESFFELYKQSAPKSYGEPND